MRKIAIVLCSMFQFLFALPALAGTCVSQTLADYISLGSAGCTVSGVDLTGFSAAAPLTPGAVQINAAGITLTPFSGPSGIGFSIVSAAPIVAGPDELLELWFGFTVSGGSGFSGNTIGIGAPTVSGDGAITMVEDQCLGGSFSSPSTGCSGSMVQQLVFAIDGISELEATRNDAATFFDVFLDLVIDGGLEGGAELGPELGKFSVAAEVTSVPEPATLPLLGLALFNLALMRRMRSLRR